MLKKLVAIFEIGLAFNFVIYQQEESFPLKKYTSTAKALRLAILVYADFVQLAFMFSHRIFFLSSLCLIVFGLFWIHDLSLFVFFSFGTQ